ncbi:hypothetical protein IAT38_002104 [Cryptococcus sp. DSM 104549]
MHLPRWVDRSISRVGAVLSASRRHADKPVTRTAHRAPPPPLPGSIGSIHTWVGTRNNTICEWRIHVLLSPTSPLPPSPTDAHRALVLETYLHRWVGRNYIEHCYGDPEHYRTMPSQLAYTRYVVAAIAEGMLREERFRGFEHVPHGDRRTLYKAVGRMVVPEQGKEEREEIKVFADRQIGPRTARETMEAVAALRKASLQ